jgi:cytochrome d ubiquinol oxidase subunit I
VTVDLARSQFALTALAHYFFVALTLGLITVLVVVQLAETVRPTPARAAMLRFWGQVYLVNYALGIGTGIVMELQLALNWSGLTRVAGEVVGAPLALETVVAFAAEATFLGLWVFARDRMPRWAHLLVLVAVAATAYASAWFVIAANAFLQHPVGYTLDAGIMRLTDPSALFSNVALPTAMAHVLAGAVLTGGVFVAAVSSVYLWRGRRDGHPAGPVDVRMFRSSQRLGMVVAAVAAPLTVIFGGLQFTYLDEIQPTKFAADGAAAAARVADWTARFGPGDRLPDPSVTGPLAALMFLTGVLAWMVLWTVVATTPWAWKWRPVQLVLVATAFLPFLANGAGWLLRELGRAPWAIYGVLPVEQGVSGSLTAGRAVAQMVVFLLVIGTLVVLDAALITRMVRRYARLGRPAWVLWPDPPDGRDRGPRPLSVPSLVPDGVR